MKFGVRRLTAAACCVLGMLAGVTCGGTTGREGLSSGGSDDGGALDGQDLDGGGFDVLITYVDRVLPDIVAPPEGATSETYPWPTCAPFIPVGPDGGAVPAGAEINQIPAEYDGDGGEIPAPDGSACATYGWLGSTAVDNCLTSQASGFGMGDFPFLPACNWCADGGIASQGPGAGLPNYMLCLNLYTCALRTGCGAAENPSACLCGDAPASECIVDAGGPCATEELAALQATPSAIQTALTNYTQFDPDYDGYCGSSLNFVFQNARTNGCFLLLDGGGNP
jgi:hypothetical protein